MADTETRSTEELDSPSHDLADLTIGPVLFVSGMFLILEIGSTLAISRRSASPLLANLSSQSLTIEAVVAAIEIGLVVMLLAMERVHPAAAGIRLRRVPSGVGLGLAVWGLSQLTLAIVALGRRGNFSLYVGWSDPAAMVAPLLERFLTDVFAEEIFWRGVFFVWIIRSLERISWKTPLTRLGTALVGSQMMFGIARLPAHLLDPGSPVIPPGAALVIFTTTGMFYALVYLRTGNLWLVMAVHALTLWPVPVFAFDLDPAKLTVVIAAVLLIPTGVPPGGREDSRAES